MSKTHDLYDQVTATEFYDRRYREGYLDNTWDDEKKRRVEEVLRQLPIGASGRALDFGCGNGVFTEVVGRALPGWEVVGTDISNTALALARERYPQHSFVPAACQESLHGQFDFVFSHHVLEHVSDLDATAAQIVACARPHSSMLHILPCGNPGSFEHRVCSLRRDGIDQSLGDRFFHDDEGHVRRLRTHQLTDLWSPAGFRLGRAFYANQRAGALKWLTDEVHSLGFIRGFADTSRAVDARARRELLVLRLVLEAVWLVRRPQFIVKSKANKAAWSGRDMALLAASAPLYPVSALAGALIVRQARSEWSYSRERPNGSEMYLHFIR